jgi:hypothetical protein
LEASGSGRQWWSFISESYRSDAPEGSQTVN